MILFNEKQLNIDFISGEIWAVIPNYSNYLISNYGRIFSFKRKVIKHKKKSFKKKHKRTKKVLYLRTRLIDDNGKLSNSLYIHRIVAEVFCDNPAPDIKTEVHHINCNSLDNRAENLEWLTPEEHREKHKQLRKTQKESESNEA